MATDVTHGDDKSTNKVCHRVNSVEENGPVIASGVREGDVEISEIEIERSGDESCGLRDFL
jgi:hypothetical protein